MDSCFHSTETEQAFKLNTLNNKPDSISFARQIHWLIYFFPLFLEFCLLRGSSRHCCWLLWPLFHPCCHAAYITQSMYLIFNQQFPSLTLCSLGWLLTFSLLSHSWHAWHWSCSLQMPSVCLLTLAPSLHQGSHNTFLGSTESEPFLASSWGHISIQPLNTHRGAACSCFPLHNLPCSAANPGVKSFLNINLTLPKGSKGFKPFSGLLQKLSPHPFPPWLSTHAWAFHLHSLSSQLIASFFIPSLPGWFPALPLPNLFSAILFN